mmetsp:Transcript_40466/g.77321  ORF Transcript_40466/g.77321 Transcript_40466/m.77321 type:complete len:198 (+) Transcript_40466:2293-2886(+)
MVAKHCPNIVRLEVGHCFSLNATTVAKLVASCPNLKHLLIPHCSQINDAALFEIAGAPYGKTPGLRRLETLDVTGCSRVTDKGVHALQKCQNLQVLRLAWCTKITDYAFQGLLPSMQSLKTLNVRGCNKLSMKTVRMCINCTPFLEKLDIVACDLIDGNEAAGTMVRSMYSLKEILSNQVIISGESGVSGLRARIRH